MADDINWSDFLSKAATRAEDTLGNMVDTTARGGHPLQIIASGLSGALDTDYNKEKKARAMKAVLEAQELPNQYRRAEEAHKEIQRSRRLSNEGAEISNATNRLKGEEARATSNNRVFAQNRQYENAALLEKIKREKMLSGAIKSEGDVFDKNVSSLYPAFNDCSDNVKSDVMKSREYKEAKTLSTAFRIWQKSQNDPVYKDVLDQFMHENGLRMSKGENGEDTLRFSNGFEIALNEENLEKVLDLVNTNFGQELDTHISLSGARDNVLKNVLGKVGRDHMQMFGGSLSNSVKAYSNFVASYPEQVRREYLLVDGYKDAMSDGVLTQEEKNSIFPQLMELAQKLGLRVDTEKMAVLNDDGSAVPVQKFIEDMEARNPIKKDWENYTNGLQRDKMIEISKKDGGMFFNSPSSSKKKSGERADPENQKELEKLENDRRQAGRQMRHQYDVFHLDSINGLSPKKQKMAKDAWNATIELVEKDMEANKWESLEDIPDEQLEKYDSLWRNKIGKDYRLNPDIVTSPIQRELEKRKKKKEAEKGKSGKNKPKPHYEQLRDIIPAELKAF